MLRRFAAGTSAALVAVGFAVAPAWANGLPAATSAVSSESDLPSPLADISAAHRNTSPPTVGTPIPETPNSPPSDESGPGGPGPGDSGPPSPSGPPVDSSSPPPSPDVTPPPGPPVEAPAPTPPAPQAAPRGPSGENVLPTAEKPHLPQTAAESQPLTVAGGASLIAAGLAWIGGARRRRTAADSPVA